MEIIETIKLTKKQIQSLASGLESSSRNHRLKDKKRRSYSTERKTDDTHMYLETRNFKIEKLKRNGELNR